MSTGPTRLEYTFPGPGRAVARRPLSCRISTLQLADNVSVQDWWSNDERIALPGGGRQRPEEHRKLCPPLDTNFIAKDPAYEIIIG